MIIWICLNQKKHTEDYNIRKPNDKKFLFKIEDKKSIYVGKKLVTFETNEKIVKYFSALGFNDGKKPFDYG